MEHKTRINALLHLHILSLMTQVDLCNFANSQVVFK